MSTTHTPGPWAADITDWPLLITSADDSGRCIAQINEADQYWPNDTESHANARLIAEAPAMLAMLRDLLDGAVLEPGRAAVVRALLARVEGTDVVE